MTTAQLAFQQSLSSRRATPEAPLVCIVDDDPSARETLESLLGSAGWDLRTFSSAEEFLAGGGERVPRCLILDVSLPNLDGLALQRRVVEDRGETAVIFVSDRTDIATVVQAMKGGAAEFFPKPVCGNLLLIAVADAIEQSRVALARGTEQRSVGERYQSLSGRERQVLARVVAGYLDKQIADELCISEITVKAHRGKMMRKMKVRSVPDLVKNVAKLELAEAVAA